MPFVSAKPHSADLNNGLYFYRARYYDPILKRFISEDPIGLAGGWNVYAYVEGDPINYIDPEGLRRPPRPSGNARDRRAADRAAADARNIEAQRKEWIRQLTGGRDTNMENVADIVGDVTGGSNRINHPSVGPTIIFPERPGQCSMVCNAAGGNSCRSNDGCQLVCGPVASQGRGR